MSVFSLCGICVTGAVAVLVLRELRREYVPYLVLAVGVTVLVSVLPRVGETVTFAHEIAAYADGEYVSVLLRALGISYLTAAAADLCRCSGDGNIASYVEAVGRVELIALSLPLLRELLSLALLK